MPISESAIRGRLQHTGYSLCKSRTRNEDHPAYGCFMILDPFRRTSVAGTGPFGPDLTLEDAEEWSNDLERNDLM